MTLENKSCRKFKNWYFPLTIFKHGLLGRSTFLFHYSYKCQTPLESSWFGQLKYAISPSKDLRSKNNSSLKGKIHQETARSLWGMNSCEQVWTGVKTFVSGFEEVWTGVSRCEEVWTLWTSQNRCEVLFFLDRKPHAAQILPTLRWSCSISTLSKSLQTSAECRGSC